MGGRGNVNGGLIGPGGWSIAVVRSTAQGWGLIPGLPQVVFVPVGQGRKRLVRIKALLAGRTGRMEASVEAKPKAAKGSHQPRDHQGRGGGRARFVGP